MPPFADEGKADTSDAMLNYDGRYFALPSPFT